MTRGWDDATLERVLRAASGAAPEPATAPESVAALADRVVDRLVAEPRPSVSWPSRAVGRLLDAGRWVRGRVGRLTAALVVLVLGVAVSPVGAQVQDWFDFHGVLVGPETDEPSGEPTVPPAGDDLTVEEAARLVAFRPVVPRALGTPDAVSVSRDGRLLSMSWETDRGRVRLDQFDGRVVPAFYKASDDARRVEVGVHEGLWFPRPHAVDVLTPSGQPTSLEPRLAAPTLVWEQDGVTLRLEGHHTLGESVVVAESAE